MIQEAGKYTCATAEYTGLVSFGMLKHGGRLIKYSVLKVTTPLGRGLMKPFVSLKRIKPLGGSRRARGNTATERAYFDSRFDSVEAQLERIEEKLAWLERHGLPSRTRAVVVQSPPRQVDQARHALLRQIVEANIALITAEAEKK
jgi:hypothetical protein